jgi:1-pyrroline-5-carboxylate dehydrogenase
MSYAFNKPENEPVKDYLPGSVEKKSLKEKILEFKSKQIEVPLIIGGRDIKTNSSSTINVPHDHKVQLGKFYNASHEHVDLAIESNLKAWKIWSQVSLEKRCNIFNKAADLLSTTWRDTINAATMLNMSKNVYQAEIDAACEMIDFFRFNSWYAYEISQQQPMYSSKHIKNSLEMRPLEGFVFAVSPFNFASIGGNLPSSPALMGNVALWKPASSAVLPAYFIMKLLQESGLPDGVINFIPGAGSKIGSRVLENPNLAGIHFTGSTKVFKGMWKSIGENIDHYKTYPRIVGETGGKDFCIAHESANIEILVTAMIRGAFEYQGQKCSAMSRAYIPNTIWPAVKEMYTREVNKIKTGDPEDFSNFMNAVIDKPAYESIKKYIDDANVSSDAEIITGGKCDDSKGYFIEPTTIVCSDPKYKTMCEEIFGPVLSIYVYEPSEWDNVLNLIDSTSEYALTGCVISEDQEGVISAKNILTHSAGNFYINDKPTGAVVGQQPFGGSRASGTNDKAGSMFNLIRWVSMRTVKESLNSPKDFKYPFMDEA